MKLGQKFTLLCISCLLYYLSGFNIIFSPAIITMNYRTIKVSSLLHFVYFRILTLVIVASQGYKLHFVRYRILSNNNPCFRCNITITNFLVSHTYEIRLMTSKVNALFLCIPTHKFLNMADLRGQMIMFLNLVFLI